MPEAQKSQRVGAGFSLVRRDRDSNSGTKKIGHSLAGCCITTLPPLQSSLLGRRSFASLGRAKIVKSFLVRRLVQKEFVSWHDRMSLWDVSRIQKLNNTMKKLLFLGAFALFAFAASAQSTQAPADKKAKTEQTCVQGCSKASLHQGRQSHLRQVQVCRMLLQGRFGVDKCQGQFLQQVCFCRLLQQVSQGVRIC